MKDLHKSLTMFGMDYDGHYPSEKVKDDAFSSKQYGPRILQQLVDANLIDSDDLQLFLHIPKGHDPIGNWIYFADQKNTDNLGFPLLISPEIGTYRVVLRIGGDVRKQTMIETQEIISSAKGVPIEIPIAPKPRS